jgi:hypothetical protein
MEMTKMKTQEFTVIATDEAPDQSTGNRLRFRLEFMVMMLQVGRTEEAARAYDQLIEEFDKIA